MLQMGAKPEVPGSQGKKQKQKQNKKNPTETNNRVFSVEWKNGHQVNRKIFTLGTM